MNHIDTSSDEFLAARDAAVARLGGVLSGRFVLVDGVLRRTSWTSAPAGFVDVRPDDQRVVGQQREMVREEEVALDVHIEMLADHRGGAVLELMEARDGRVRTIWWRGDNHDRGETIPPGFLWEKNDDYYYGWVEWDELGPARFRYRVFPRRQER